MSLGLVAVQRDAALLDALSARFRAASIDSDMRQDADPVVGLLAALVADVDDGLADLVDRKPAPVLIPEQSRHRALPAAVSPMSVPLAPAGRRHVARAVAAMVVTAAVLSVSGVAAAVSGDPLRPYKDVINVVRGGYHEVVPNRSLVVPQPMAAVPKAKAGATPAAGQPRDAAVPSTHNASRPASAHHGVSRDAWQPRTVSRQGPDRGVWDRHDDGSRPQSGSPGPYSGPSDDDSGPSAGGDDGGGSDGGDGTEHDLAWHEDGSGDWRR
jgi:hypothetical protein